MKWSIIFLSPLHDYQLLNNFEEEVVDSFTGLRTRLSVQHVILFSYLTCLCVRDLLFLFFEVALVARHGEYKICPIIVAIIVHFVDPVEDRLEALGVAHIKADECCVGIAIIHLNHRAVLLLAARVPNVKLHLLSAVGVLRVRHRHYLLEICARNRQLIQVLEAAILESVGE